MSKLAGFAHYNPMVVLPLLLVGVVRVVLRDLGNGYLRRRGPLHVLLDVVLADVFQVEAAILTDPNGGTPICVPYRTTRPAPSNVT